MTAPADELVAKGRAVPVISPAPLVPVADFGPVDRLQGWAMTAVITALAALTRFLNLGSPTDAGTPIFDEKHYAPQAWQLLHNHGVEDNPGYGLVVHPPVGKQLIAIGEALFGYNGLGWRFSGAVCGVILVLLVVRIGRRISRSTLVGGIAGLLLIADGVSFVASRTALLDGFLTLFVVAAFGCLMVDRDQVRERMHVALLEGRIGETPWGPRLGARWWPRTSTGTSVSSSEMSAGSSWSRRTPIPSPTPSSASSASRKRAARSARPARNAPPSTTGTTSRGSSSGSTNRPSSGTAWGPLNPLPFLLVRGRDAALVLPRAATR